MRFRTFISILSSLFVRFSLLAGLSGIATAGELSTYITTSPGSDVSVKITSLYKNVLAVDYIPIRVDIENRSARDRTWSLSYNNQIYPCSKSEFNSTISAASGEKLSRIFLLPTGYCSSASYHGNTSGTIRGYGINSGTFSLYVDYSEQKAFLADNSVKTYKEGLSTSERAQISGTLIDDFTSYLDFQDFQSDWRFYSGFSAVFLTSSRYQQLPSSSRRALNRWVRGGGELVLFDDDISLEGRIINMGKGTVYEIIGDYDKLSKVRVGRGNSNFSIRGVDRKELKELQDYTGLGSGVIGAITAVIIGYWFLVIPINLLVLAPKKRRLSVLITTPVIATVISSVLWLIFNYGIGYGSEGHRWSLVKIYPSLMEAHLEQEQVVASALVDDDSFTAPSGTHFIERTDNRATDQYNAYSYGVVESALKWEREASQLKTSGDWFRNRAVSEIGIKQIVDFRQDLKPLGLTNEGWQFESTIATNLAFVAYRSGRELYYGENITPGTFTLAPYKRAPRRSDFNRIIEEKVSELSREQLKLMTREMGNGAVVAIARHSENYSLETLPDIVWKSDLMMIIRYPEGEGEY